MRLLVLQWLKAGAPLDEGVRLFALAAGDQHPFLKLIRHNHQASYPILIGELCRRADVSPLELNENKKFRDDWAFLNKLDCPKELKVLAADKITAYHNYVQAHEMLFDCRNPEEQFATVKNLVENFIENRAIIKEFLHYKEHSHVLGEHRVFQEMKNLRRLRKISPVQMVERKKQLEQNIWRIQDLLKKKDKPHLTVERERRLKLKKTELAELERLINIHR